MPIHDDLTPREMLAVVYDRTERILRLLDGNGQQGLLQDFADLESRVALIESEDKDAANLGRRGAVGATTGGVLGVIAAIVVAVREAVNSLGV